MEHNYDNLHLKGSYSEMREMVHNRRKIEYSHSTGLIGNLVNGIITVAIGGILMGEIIRQLRKTMVIK